MGNILTGDYYIKIRDNTTIEINDDYSYLKDYHKGYFRKNKKYLYDYKEDGYSLLFNEDNNIGVINISNNVFDYYTTLAFALNKFIHSHIKTIITNTNIRHINIHISKKSCEQLKIDPTFVVPILFDSFDELKELYGDYDIEYELYAEE